MQGQAEVSAANQQQLREAMLAVPDVDFSFSLIELSELLEHACFVASTHDGVLVSADYDAKFAAVLAAFAARGNAVLQQMAAILEEIQASTAASSSALQRLLDVCTG